VPTRIASWVKKKTPTPASDVLRDAKDAPLEGLGWIHGFIPSSPLLFKRTVRRPELRKIVPLTDTTIYEMERHG
jgi:prophage regulatory protein